MEKHLKLLGHRATSLISGFKGVITSISFDVNGCIQAAINPGVDKEGKIRDSLWFDVKAIFITSKKPVLRQPDFVVVPGGNSLPLKNV